MSGCEKCLDNAWDFKYNEGWIVATCRMCGHEVQFEARKGKRRRRFRKPDVQTDAYKTNPPGSMPPW